MMHCQNWSATPIEFPSETWRAHAEKFLTRCRENLETSPEAREFMKPFYSGMDAAVRHGCGWNPRDTFRPRRAWGLEGEGLLKLPAGLVVPVFRDERLLRLRVFPPRGYPVTVAGSASGPAHYFRPRRAAYPCLVVPSELDAMIVTEGHGRVDAIALSGAWPRLDPETDQRLAAALVFYVAKSPDDPAIRWFEARYGAEWIRPPAGYPSIAAAARAGIAVRFWVDDKIPQEFRFPWRRRQETDMELKTGILVTAALDAPNREAQKLGECVRLLQHNDPIPFETVPEKVLRLHRALVKAPKVEIEWTGGGPRAVANGKPVGARLENLLRSPEIVTFCLYHPDDRISASNLFPRVAPEDVPRFVSVAR